MAKSPDRQLLQAFVPVIAKYNQPVADALTRLLNRGKHKPKVPLVPCTCYRLQGAEFARDTTVSPLVICAHGRGQSVCFYGANFKTIGRVKIALEQATLPEELAQWNQVSLNACMRVVTGIADKPFQVELHWVDHKGYFAKPCQIVWRGTVPSETTTGRDLTQ